MAAKDSHRTSDVHGKTARQIYEAGPGRKIAFSFLFLLLLPFFVSLGPMLFYRFSSGQPAAIISLIVIGIGLALLMLLVTLELFVSLRSRVAFGKTAVHITLPLGRGVFPSFRFRKEHIAYDDIQAVEIRREVIGGSIAPVLMKGAAVLKKDGTLIPLGYVNEANADPALPFGEIGEKIASKAGVELVDVGCVRCEPARALGLATISSLNEGLTEVEDAEILNINRRHDRLVMMFVATLIVLVGLGIFIDRDTRYPWANPSAVADAAQDGA